MDGIELLGAGDPSPTVQLALDLLEVAYQREARLRELLERARDGLRRGVLDPDLIPAIDRVLAEVPLLGSAGWAGSP